MQSFENYFVYFNQRCFASIEIISDFYFSILYSPSYLASINQFLKGFGFLPIVRDFEDNNQYNIVYVNSALLEDADIAIQIKNWIHRYFFQIGLEIQVL